MPKRLEFSSEEERKEHKKKLRRAASARQKERSLERERERAESAAKREEERRLEREEFNKSQCERYVRDCPKILGQIRVYHKQLRDDIQLISRHLPASRMWIEEEREYHKRPLSEPLEPVVDVPEYIEKLGEMTEHANLADIRKREEYERVQLHAKEHIAETVEERARVIYLLDEYPNLPELSVDMGIERLKLLADQLVNLRNNLAHWVDEYHHPHALYYSTYMKNL